MVLPEKFDLFSQIEKKKNIEKWLWPKNKFDPSSQVKKKDHGFTWKV